jgi:membrane-bound lytic murein transglycosylase F
LRNVLARLARPTRLPAPTSALAIAFGLLLAGCRPSETPAPPPALPVDALVVAMRPGPTSWHVGPDGRPAGFEHDLVARFAAEAGLQLKVVPVASAGDLAAKLVAGEAHVGIGSLYRPPEASAPSSAEALVWTTGIYPSEPVIVYNVDGYRPKGWADLRGATVAYLRGSGLEVNVAATASIQRDVRFVAHDLPTADALIARVSEGAVDYALVSALKVADARHIYLGFDVAFAAGPKFELAWLVPAHETLLRERLDAFIARLKAGGHIERLVDRYFGHRREVHRIDAATFHERMRSVLPDYRKLFHDAQETSGIEWRLLAAVAYQESQWEPLATSETGVRGFMQLTEETARHLGVADRLDPRSSIAGAARYLRDLKGRLPARIKEPDRTWLALAAFNIGLGHLEDARILAQRQKLNPDAWHDVRQALPLLAQAEYYEQAKLGYARGGMPVAFVDRVRAYYDILLRHEAAHNPRLRVPAQAS